MINSTLTPWVNGNFKTLHNPVVPPPSDMIGELQRLHPTLTLMSASEPELGPLLRAAAGAVSRCAAAEQAVTDAQPAQLAQPLREYVLYAEAIREALGRRDAVQAQFESTAAEIQRKEAERAQVRRSGESEREEDSLCREASDR